MSIEPDRDQFFQYATFVVVGLTLVICSCYGLIFLNPRANLITGLQPYTPTVRVSVFILPATWTPTPTLSPTPTLTASPTDTPTNTPTLTPLPTNTPPPTATRLVPTLPPPTVRPTTRPPAPPPPPPAPPVPTANASASFVAIKHESWPNCGTWYLQGTVWANGYGKGFVPGVRVRALLDSGGSMDAISGQTGRNNPAYWEILLPKGQAASGRIGIVDDSGNLETPQWYSFHMTADCKGSSAVNEVIMDFARQ